jgi:hypothetical protein
MDRTCFMGRDPSALKWLAFINEWMHGSTFRSRLEYLQ